MNDFRRVLVLSVAALMFACSGCKDRASMQEPTANAQSAKLELADLRGRWAIVDEDGEQAAEPISIIDEGPYGWKLPGGRTTSVTFDQEASSALGVIALTYESSEDSPTVGGGGPRKGIARRLESGELEFLVAPSSAWGYSDEFSDLMSVFRLRRM